MARKKQSESNIKDEGTDLDLTFERLAALRVPVPIPMHELRWGAYRLEAILSSA